MARYSICNRAVHPPIRSRGLDSVQTTGETAERLHGATSAFDHEDNLDGQSDKQGNIRTTGLPYIEDLLIRNNIRSLDRLPKQMLYSQLYFGHRKIGRLVSDSGIPSRET